MKYLRWGTWPLPLPKNTKYNWRNVMYFSHYLLVNVILYVRQTYCKAWHYSPSLEPGIIYVLNFIIPVGIMWFEFGTSKKTVWKLSPRSRISNGGRWQQQLIAYSGANFTFEGCRTTSNFKNRIYFLAVGVKSRVRSSGVKLPCLGLTWIPRYTKDS